VRRSLVVLFAAVGLVPGHARAQLSWDEPSLIGPYAPQGLSVFLLDPDPGDNLGALVHWRHDSASLGLGYRAGIARDATGVLAGLAGVDVSGILAHAVEDADIQVLWWTGIGAGLGNNLTVSVPLGLAAGWRGLGDENVFAPYAGAHVSLDMSTREGGGVVSMRPSLDIGLDLTLVSGFLVRVGASVGERSSLAMGLRLPGAHPAR
jgi:hypothetical protein